MFLPVASAMACAFKSTLPIVTQLLNRDESNGFTDLLLHTRMDMCNFSIMISHIVRLLYTFLIGARVVWKASG